MLARFSEAPERCALETPDSPPMSFAELDSAAARCANALCDTGVGAGDRVAVQVDKSIAALVIYLACLRSGAVFVPINTAYKSQETMQILEDALPKLVICSPDNESLLRSAIDQHAGFQTPRARPVVTSVDASGNGAFWQRVLQQTNVHSVARLTAEDPAVVLYTSGTTGKPKGAILSQRALCTNARTLGELWKIDATDKIIHCLPLFHAHGLFVVANVALLAGATMIWLGRFHVPDVVDSFSKATVFMGVPTLYTRLLDSRRLSPSICGSMRLFLSGSAPLSPQTHDDFKSQTGHEIVERYGMTETGINASNPVEGRRIPGTVGLPLPGIEIRVVDDNGAQTRSAAGEVQIRGPNLFSGYWNRPDETAAAIDAHGWFSSGDIGQFDETGYLSLLSRKKDVIITGGYNVYPTEIEALFEKIEGVQEVAVFGAPHPDFGEGVVAAVVLKIEHERDFDEGRMISKLKMLVANYKVPKRILSVSSLPRNAMGKITKPDLRERYHETFAEPVLAEQRGG